MAKVVQVIDRESFFALIHVSRETMERLAAYESCLLEWQKGINLVAPSTLPRLWHRHFWDSAQLADHIPTSVSRWVDLGSGAGFPGLVLALIMAERQKFEVHLIESDQRKAVFLREIVRRTGAKASVHVGRMEDPAIIAKVGTCDGVSARACAPLDRLLGWAYPYFDENTYGLFMKGAKVEEELTEAKKSWKFVSTSLASQSEAGGTVLKVEHLARD